MSNIHTIPLTSHRHGRVLRLLEAIRGQALAHEPDDVLDEAAWAGLADDIQDAIRALLDATELPALSLAAKTPVAASCLANGAVTITPTFLHSSPEKTSPEPKQTWFVTFMQTSESHPFFPGAHPDGYLRVIASTEDEARRLVDNKCGPYWAFLYPENDFDASPSRYPLGELGEIGGDTNE